MRPRLSRTTLERVSGGNGTQRRTFVRPVPGGWPLRAGLIALAVGFMVSDVISGSVTLSTPAGWFALVIPYLPLLVLPVGILAGAVTTIVVFVVTMSVPSDSLMLGAAFVPTVVAIGFAGYGLTRRMALVCAAIFLLLLTAAAVLDPARLTAFLGTALIGALAASAGLAADIFRTRSEVATRRVRRLREEQARIRAEERARLALELHDVVAHDVTVIAMQARRAEVVQDPERTAAILESIGDSASNALQDLRRLVALLSAEVADDVEAANGAAGARAADEAGPAAAGAEGLAAQIGSVTSDLERAGFPVALEIDGDLTRVPVSVWQASVRTMRELGTNVLKYADPARQVAVRLAVGESHLQLTVQNAVAEVAGGTATPSTRAGIEAMRARCEVFGGTVRAGVVATQETTGAPVQWCTAMTVPLVHGVVPQSGTTDESMTGLRRKEGDSE